MDRELRRKRRKAMVRLMAARKVRAARAATATVLDEITARQAAQPGRLYLLGNQSACKVGKTTGSADARAAAYAREHGLAPLTVLDVWEVANVDQAERGVLAILRAKGLGLEHPTATELFMPLPEIIRGEIAVIFSEPANRRA